MEAYSERYSFFLERNEKELADISKRSLEVWSAKYSIAAKQKRQKADRKYAMPIFGALRMIKRECTEENFKWWLSQVRPTLLRFYEYLTKLKSLI